MVEEWAVLKVLLDLTRTLGQEGALEAALKSVTDAAMLLLPGDHASVRLLDDSRTELLCGARSGKGVGERPMSFRPGRGVISWVVEHDQFVRIADVELDPRWEAWHGQGFEVRSIMAAPLRSGGTCVGVLSVSSPEVGAYSADDELLSRLLANCAVPPIDRVRLRRLALTDHMTRAYNHRYLAPRLGEELERARRDVQPLSLMLLDLDYFKRVNDLYGHPVGDRLLRAFADRVREEVRRHDVFIRRGGEEFVLIMPNTAMAEARPVAERICRSLAAVPLVVDAALSIAQTVSIGVATWDSHEAAEGLEKRADDAMYEAKAQGRNCVVVARRD